MHETECRYPGGGNVLLFINCTNGVSWVVFISCLKIQCAVYASFGVRKMTADKKDRIHESVATFMYPVHQLNLFLQ